MKYFFYLALSLWMMVSACNDPTLVGTGILDDETIEIDFTDTIDIKARTVMGDSVVTFRKTATDIYSASTYMAGVIEDAFFGRTEVISYCNINLVAPLPELDSVLLDSVVIAMVLDTLGSYGADGIEHQLEILPLQDTMTQDTLYSNEKLEYDAMADPIFSGPYYIDHRAPTTIMNYMEDTLQELPAQIRIPMDTSLWMDFYRDQIAMNDTITSDALNEFMPGFAIKSSAVESSMIGLNLQYAVTTGASNILFYYSEVVDTTVTKTVYRIPLGQRRHQFADHDLSGSDLEQDLNQEGADLLYIQTLGGVLTEINVSGITDYSDRILNSAVLEVTVMQSPVDGHVPFTDMIAVFEEDGGLVPVLDFSVGQAVHGGTLEERNEGGLMYQVYELNITTHLRSIQQGNEIGDKILLIPDRRAQLPHRVMLYNSNHTEYPARLKMVITEP